MSSNPFDDSQERTVLHMPAAKTPGTVVDTTLYWRRLPRNEQYRLNHVTLLHNRFAAHGAKRAKHKRGR